MTALGPATANQDDRKNNCNEMGMTANTRPSISTAFPMASLLPRVSSSSQSSGFTSSSPLGSAPGGRRRPGNS